MGIINGLWANCYGSGGILNQIKVPLAYGPKQKFLARLDQEAGFEAPLAIKLPRMAFEITSLEIDDTQKLQKRNKIVETHASDITKRKTISHYTSYNIGMSLYILTKNQDERIAQIKNPPVKEGKSQPSKKRAEVSS